MVLWFEIHNVVSSVRNGDILFLKVNQENVLLYTEYKYGGLTRSAHGTSRMKARLVRL